MQNINFIEILQEAKSPANILSLLRIPIGILVILSFDNKPLFLSLLVIGAFTDILDGHVARRVGSTKHGAAFDGLSDKIFFGSILFASVNASALNIWQFFPLMMRDITVIALAIAVLRHKRGKLLIPKLKSRGPSKAATLGQFIAIGWLLLFGSKDFTFLFYVISAISFIAAIDYILFVKKNL